MTKHVNAGRQHIRADLIGKKVSGIATRIRTHEQCSFFVWDVSMNGLGIWLSEDFPLDSEIELISSSGEQLKLSGKIVWKHPHPDLGGIRCGLEVTVGHQSLKRFYMDHRNKQLLGAS